MAENKTAVVTIDEIKKQEKGFCKFVAQGKTFNYKFDPEKEPMDLSPFFEVGKKVTLDYREFEYTQGPAAGKLGRYINKVSTADKDAPNTFTGSSSSYQGGGKGGGGKKSDFDPHLSAKQTAANCAMSYCAAAKLKLEELQITFPAVADIVHKWLTEPDPIEQAKQALDATEIDPAYEQAVADDDIPF